MSFFKIIDSLLSGLESLTRNNNQLILEGLIRAMPQLTKRNQLM